MMKTENLLMKYIFFIRKINQSQVSFFSFMTAPQKDSIAHTLITNKFQTGQLIVNEGDQADSYFVIKSGEVSVWKGNK